MSDRTWREPDEEPQAAGWYIVERIDSPGEERIRAYGQGHWWIPLLDGWLSADGYYRWHHLPVAAIESGERSPYEEMLEVQALVEEQR